MILEGFPSKTFMILLVSSTELCFSTLPARPSSSLLSAEGLREQVNFSAVPNLLVKDHPQWESFPQMVLPKCCLGSEPSCTFVG